MELGNQGSSGDAGTRFSPPPVSRKILFYFFSLFYKRWREFKEKGQILSLPPKEKATAEPSSQSTQREEDFLSTPQLCPEPQKNRILRGTRDPTINHRAEGKLAVTPAAPGTACSPTKGHERQLISEYTIYVCVLLVQKSHTTGSQEVGQHLPAKKKKPQISEKIMVKRE